jgi:predicted membrane-bound dolichyl-phosphate-mannose-protein mannosyltransferase
LVLDYLEGLLKIANLVLAFIAGGIALSLFKVSHERKELRAWKILIVVLIFFIIQMVLGALRAFGIYNTSFLTHVNVSFLLVFLIYALALQIHTHLVEK